jgi:hypothetical protein
VAFSRTYRLGQANTLAKIQSSFLPASNADICKALLFKHLFGCLYGRIRLVDFGGVCLLPG